MTAEEMVLAYWGYGTDYNPTNLSQEQQNELKNTVLLMHEWENHKMKKVKADAAYCELLNTAQEREIDKLKREVIGMDGEIGLLKKWLSDALTTIAEEPESELSTLRSELSAAQAQAKALSAIKKGLETSLTEALSSLSAAQEENKRLKAELQLWNDANDCRPC